MVSNEERREVAARMREIMRRSPNYFLENVVVRSVLDVMGEGMTIGETVAALIDPQTIDGNTSDGYHTFNELYHHRAVLFSVIVKNFATRAWKSKLHADGTMYEGMFIVGIETPDGQATYHYDVEPYWNLFRCKEVDRAPERDGHTPDQAIERIGKLVSDDD